MSHILVVDDDKRLRGLLQKYLEGEGFAVSVAKDAAEAREMLAVDSYDLLVLDVMMPEESGIDLTRELRKNSAQPLAATSMGGGYSNIPILLLTAMAEVEDRINGLESGADDYLTKPFEPRELCLRIKNLLQRANVKPVQSRVIKFGDYIFKLVQEELCKNGEAVTLTSTEQTLLLTLAKNLNEPVSREKISAELNNISERSIDVQITRLRKKLEFDPKNADYLKTVRGKGYVLKGVG